MDSDSDRLISLISQLMSLEDTTESDSDLESNYISLIIQIISVVSSMDLDSQPKPESKLISLITQTISLFNSMDLDSQPKPLSQLISLISQKKYSIDSEEKPETDLEFSTLVTQTVSLDPEPDLVSLIYQIFLLVQSMNSNWRRLISLSPQLELVLEQGKFYVQEEVEPKSNNKWHCLPLSWDIFRLKGEEATHFLCQGCNGQNHEEYNKASVEIKHPLHPKHFLQLVFSRNYRSRTRECYCCDEDLVEVFYYCTACDYAMNIIACVEKPRVLSIDHPRWHQHTLALFPSHAYLPCNLCALTHSSCPFYICPPCDFVVHQKCINLPSLIRISRHLHRISFTASFAKGDWSCGVCRRKINNDYGGYSCIKNGCSYAAHSKCATQRNVWDGTELEGEPEDIEEEIEPFVRISDGIIQHFCHQHHHLRLYENACRDYDEDVLCQACVTPTYFGNFYSCMKCEFILHEACANLPRRIYNPIHPHLLTLVGRNDSDVNDVMKDENRCSICPGLCTDGFFYECGKEGCRFKLHVQCGTISEPLVHGTHKHPLFLTCKPREQRTCSVCGNFGLRYTYETFNCIEGECDFSLCYKCATIPQKVRYKHDKHMLALTYEHKTTTMTNYWCEACERKINSRGRFYMCGEYFCVTLHIECLIGKDLYMKPGSWWLCQSRKVSVLPNNHHMSRPICSYCNRRCPYKIVFQCFESIFCSVECFLRPLNIALVVEKCY